MTDTDGATAQAPADETPPEPTPAFDLTPELRNARELLGGALLALGKLREAAQALPVSEASASLAFWAENLRDALDVAAYETRTPHGLSRVTRLTNYVAELKRSS